MISEAYAALTDGAQRKVTFYREDKLSYFIASMLAGIFVGLCMIVILVMKGQLEDFVGIKILQGVSFAAALSLIIFAGAELFTGNVFSMTAGVMRKRVSFSNALGLWTWCYLGNFVGSILVAVCFVGTGYLSGSVLDAADEAIRLKTDPVFSELVIRGLFCNFLVCAGVWCVYRMKSEGAKLIMIFWCIYLFVVCGFEHSIANMTLFSMGVMSGYGAMAMVGNLVATTIGNIFGGVILALAYWAIAKNNV